LRFIFKASNNEAEYEALIAGAQLCYAGGEDSVGAYSNSQLVISQLNGEYEAKDDHGGLCPPGTRGHWLIEALLNNKYTAVEKSTSRCSIKVGELRRV